MFSNEIIYFLLLSILNETLNDYVSNLYKLPFEFIIEKFLQVFVSSLKNNQQLYTANFYGCQNVRTV